ncbi:MAG: FkbM family methyltransferase [Verrucomicrobiales bacterium]
MATPVPLENLKLCGGRRSVTQPTGRVGHWWDFVNILLDDEYGLRRLSCQPSTIVDVGANIGLFSIWARHLFPECRLESYEPNPEVQEYLRSNLRDLGCQVHLEAVGPTTGHARIKVDRESIVGQCVASPDGEIPMVSLKCVVDRAGGRIDLMKLDIEGGEWDILRGTEPEVFSRIDRLHLEYHESKAGTLSDLIGLASTLGYRVVQCRPNQGFGLAWLDRG